MLTLPSPDTLVPLHSTPVLEARTQKELRKYWQGHIAEIDGRHYTYTSYWQEKADGATSKLQFSALTHAEPKSQADSRDQAFFNTNSDVNNQRKKGYYDLGGKRDGHTLAMLAQPWDKAGHRIVWPAAGEPKYDGERAVTDGAAMWSRTGIEHIPEVTAHIRAVVQTLGYEVDGELILPPPYKRTHTRSAVAKFREEISPLLLFRVYDVVDFTKTRLERYEICRQVVEATNHPQVVLTPMRMLEDEESAYAYHKECEQDGWEGIIVKNLHLPYKEGRPGDAMVKLKSWIDEEFQVVGVNRIEGGSHDGCARFECLAPPRVDEKSNAQPGGVFEALPLGKIPYRRELYERREEILGTIWTVRFQSYLESGIPEFARAVCERTPEVSG